MNDPINLNVKRIVDALHSAECGHEIYEALTYVPLDNLKDILAMIKHILKGNGCQPLKNA